MSTKRFAVTVTFGLLGLVLALLGLVTGEPALAQPADVSSSPSEIRVCPAGPPTCHYAVVQDALDAAGEGDVIKIATGVYSDVNSHGGLAQVAYISKTVTIQGGYTLSNWTTPDPDTHPTTLDAGGQGRVLYITGAISPTIEGLRITGGQAQGLGGIPWGADTGGGLYIVTATAVIRNNQILSNTCSGFFPLGGGMTLYNSNATVSGNTFSHNIADHGGGLYRAWSNPTISDNLFISNTAGYGGGGAYLTGGGAVFIGNILMSNTAATFGGGLVSEGGAQWFINNVIAENHAGSAGGGLWSNGSKPHLYHNTFARNSAGDGSAIYAVQTEWGEILGSNVSLTNTILVDHAVGITVAGGNTVTVNGILWHNTPLTVSQSPTAVVTVHNQHTGNPAFAADGYHLTSRSAAIDQGVKVDVPLDIDGEGRPAGAGYDLGADEVWYRIYLPLIVRGQ